MNGPSPLLDLDACRVRQARLRSCMAARSLDAVVLVAKDRSASPAVVENQDAVGRKASAAFAFRSSSAA